MSTKINSKLAVGIKALCLSEKKADVHFNLPISLKNPKVKQVSVYYLLIYV
jgi:hypothetical protein